MEERKPRRGFNSVLVGVVAALSILLLGGWWVASFINPRPDAERFPTNDTLPAEGISIPVRPSKNP
jgi:hypothetical protein